MSDLAATPTLTMRGAVAVLDLGSGENRFNEESVAAVEALLGEVEAGADALVTTAGGKIWSNGFDTPWMAANPERARPTVEAGERLVARFLGWASPPSRRSAGTVSPVD